MYDPGMDDLLAGLRACAEPTRLRLLALAARGSFCVMDFCEILGQSQPRLSRHLRLLHEAGLLERVREGANVWLALPSPGLPGGKLARLVLDQLPCADSVLEGDRRQAARVLAERARAATESFRRAGADWDEMRALDLPAERVEAALLAALPAGSIARMLDVGTGTGRLLEVIGPHAGSALGIDASRAMLALARDRLAAAGPALGHCAVRLGDMYRLSMPDGYFNVVVMHMVLHHAEDPPAVLAEASRVLAPGGTLLLADLAHHDGVAIAERLAHRWPGFSESMVAELFARAGLVPRAPVGIPGPLEIRVWSATRPASPAMPSSTTELAVLEAT